jgi:hypothetical protein
MSRQTTVRGQHELSITQLCDYINGDKMPSQIGYFDTIKSAVGKVFSFLSTITLTGVDGKTLTLNKTITLTSPDDTSVITFPAGVVSLPAESGSTWTPIYSPASGAFTSVTHAGAGEYKRIGNLVFFRATIYTNELTVGAASGAVTITGLPIAAVAGKTYPVQLSSVASFGGDMPIIASLYGQAISLWYRTSVNGADLALQVSDLSAGVGYNVLNVSGCYIAA